MKTCEFILFNERKPYPLCGKSATHLWTPRTKRWDKPREPMPVCKFHGEGLAGIWTDELKAIE